MKSPKKVKSQNGSTELLIEEILRSEMPRQIYKKNIINTAFPGSCNQWPLKEFDFTN